jgi:hypothetical protein
MTGNGMAAQTAREFGAARAFSGEAETAFRRKMRRYLFCADGHGAPQGAQAPAKSSGETARADDGLARWSATTAASPAISTNA